MVSVRCPACDRRLEAADGDILSASLSVHFAREHGLVLPDPQLLRGGREGPLSGEAELDATMGQDEVRGGSEIYGAGLTQRGSDLYGVEGPPQLARAPPEGPFVECPLCGFRVLGGSEDELTTGLREHMGSTGELAAVKAFPQGTD